MTKTSIEKVGYGDWPNCYRLANARVDLVVTTDVGPRVIRFGFAGDDNEFCEIAGQLGQTGGNQWRIYGGHRLWHAPEENPRTYFPDNAPVKLEQHTGFVRLVQPVEKTTGIQKEMDVALLRNKAGARIVHRLRNRNASPVELAPWAISVMAPGGVCIAPLPPRAAQEKNLLPTGSLALWAYTDLSDPRWTFFRHHILLRQDSRAKTAQKIGLPDVSGWAAYARAGHLFVKKFKHHAGASYPDFGSSFEAYVNGEFLEVETLAPLAVIAPGAEVEHVEEWLLFRDVPEPKTEADIQRHILPRTS